MDTLLDAYLEKNKITEQQMTPALAKDFVQEVLGSGDPRIRGLVLKIERDALRYMRVYGPRPGGDEE